MANQPVEHHRPAAAAATAATQSTHANIIGEELHVDSSADNDSTFGDYPDSTTTSLASSVTNYRYEHGRRYHAIEDGSYSLPNDEEEVDRLNLQHQVWEIAFNGKLYLSPLNIDSTHEVLDIGCGTGAWCIDFADALPGVQVLGTDLSPIQPHNVPVNCEFVVDDANADWTFGPARFDFIHTRTVLLGIKNWDALIQQCFNALRPGGWVELQEFHIPIGCDDGTAGPDSAVATWGANMHEGFKNLGVDSLASLKFRELLEKAGFEAVEEAHTKFPLGTWPKGEKEKQMGALFQEDIAENLQGLSVKVLTQGLGWSVEQVNELVAKAQSDIYNSHVHSYFPIDIFWARKPA